MAVHRDSLIDVDSLRAGWSGKRIPVGARYSAPVHTGPLSLLGDGYRDEIGSGVALTPLTEM
jgi:hypothetical protein